MQLAEPVLLEGFSWGSGRLAWLLCCIRATGRLVIFTGRRTFASLVGAVFQFRKVRKAYLGQPFVGVMVYYYQPSRPVTGCFSM
jgi:hypothetical protein